MFRICNSGCSIRCPKHHSASIDSIADLYCKSINFWASIFPDSMQKSVLELSIENTTIVRYIDVKIVKAE
jgi:hypothetical protein